MAHPERIAGMGVRDLRGRGPEEDVVVPIDRLDNGVLFAVMRHVTGGSDIRAVLRPGDSRKQHG